LGYFLFYKKNKQIATRFLASFTGIYASGGQKPFHTKVIGHLSLAIGKKIKI